jgi:hypothetical protein
MQTFIVAVYFCDRYYGGPEEGGWWYDAGKLVRVIKATRSEDKAYAYCRRLNDRLRSRDFGPNQGRRDIGSVASEGEHQAHVWEGNAPQIFLYSFRPVFRRIRMVFQMEDGTVINTEKAAQRWDETRWHNGQNFISKATGQQFSHETLYESRKGRFYKCCHSDYQGSHDHCEWLDERAAVRWLLLNKHPVPERLQKLIEQVEE